jgi:diacylglycerol kinase family enzyme
VRAGERADVEYFLESAGLGLSAIVMPAGQHFRKKRVAKLAALIRRLFGNTEWQVRVELDDGKVLQARTRLVTASNAPLAGLSFLVAPDAKMDDGLLDVALYDEMSTAELSAHFLATRNGQRADDPRIRFHRSRQVVIHADDTLPIVSDIDPIDERRNLTIDLVPQALHVIVGNGPALMLPVEAVPAVALLAGAPAAAGGDSSATSTPPAEPAPVPAPGSEPPADEAP